MLPQLIEKLNRELMTVKEKAADSPLPVGELSHYAYEIATKQLCIEAMEYLKETYVTLPEDMVCQLMQMEEPLDYLYHLWLHSDYSFAPSLADILTMEIGHDMRVSV